RVHLEHHALTTRRAATVTSTTGRLYSTPGLCMYSYVTSTASTSRITNGCSGSLVQHHHSPGCGSVMAYLLSTQPPAWGLARVRVTREGRHCHVTDNTAEDRRHDQGGATHPTATGAHPQ